MLEMQCRRDSIVGCKFLMPGIFPALIVVCDFSQFPSSLPWLSFCSCFLFPGSAVFWSG